MDDGLILFIFPRYNTLTFVDDSVCLLGNACHWRVAEGIGIKLIDLSLGILFTEAADFFLLSAVGTENFSSAPVHLRRDYFNAEAASDFLNKKIGGSGNDDIVGPFLLEVPVADEIFVLIPKLLNLAVGVGDKTHEAKQPQIENISVYVPEKTLQSRPYYKREEKKRSRQMPFKAPISECPRGVWIENCFVKIVYIHKLTLVVFHRERACCVKHGKNKNAYIGKNCKPHVGKTDGAENHYNKFYDQRKPYILFCYLESAF